MFRLVALFSSEYFMKYFNNVLFYKLLFTQKLLRFFFFFDAKETVEDFIFSFENKFVPNCKVKVQRSVELINYQPTESNAIIVLESRMI